MRCMNCGTEYTDASQGCPECGAPANYQPYDKKAAKAQYKNAKTAYKSARKAAGKSNVPKVIACIVIAVLLAGGGAFASYYLMNQKMSELKNQNTELQNRVAQLEEEANNAATAEEAKMEAMRTAIMGNWGYSAFTSAKLNGSSKAACELGKSNGVNVGVAFKTVTAKEIVADINVLFHSHDAAKAGTASGIDADKVRTFANVKGVYADGMITFTIDGTAVDSLDVALGNGSKIVAKCSFDSAYSAMTFVVQNYYQSTVQYVEDTYQLKK